MTNYGTTQTGMDIIAALRSRLESQGHLLTDQQYLTLMVDIMDTINTDSANVLSHATTELANNPKRQKKFGV